MVTVVIEKARYRGYLPPRGRNSIFPPLGGSSKGISTSALPTGILNTNCSGRRHGPIQRFCVLKKIHPEAEVLEASSPLPRRALVLRKSIISV